MRVENASNTQEALLYPPPFGDPPRKKPLPGGLCAVCASNARNDAQPRNNKHSKAPSPGALMHCLSRDRLLHRSAQHATLR